MAKQTWLKVGVIGYGAITWLVILGILAAGRGWPSWVGVIVAAVLMLGANWVLRWLPQHSVAHDYWAVGFIGCAGLYIWLT